MAKAVWNGAVIAESESTVVIEGNRYFPLDALRKEHFKPSRTRTLCPWKGEATYYNIVVAGKTNPDAAWIYADPKPEAEHFRDRVAFWRGVQVTD